MPASAKRYELSLRTTSNNFEVLPLRPYGGPRHLTFGEVAQLVAGLTGHARPALNRTLRDLGVSAFHSIERPGVTLTVTRVV